MSRRPTDNLKLRRRRRGAVVGLLLVGMVFLTGFAALAVNLARLQHIQAQLRAACCSAALAGAAELMDEAAIGGAPTQTDAAAAARSTACLLALQNPVDGRPLKLEPNTSNDPRGDLVVGWYDPAGPVNQLLQIPRGPGPHELNTLRVTARLGRNVVDRLTMWFGGMVGISSFDVAAQAQASIDRRVLGFRPEAGVKVPVAPLAADYVAWNTALAQPIDEELNDRYTVNPITGVVTAGPDGVPEITLACGNASTETQDSTTVQSTSTQPKSSSDSEDDAAAMTAQIVPCAPLVLFNELEIEYVWPVRCREGLSKGDLLPYGGELVMTPGGRTMQLEAQLPEELPYGLMDIVGQSRAWALVTPNSEGNGNAMLAGFGGGRIVAVRPIENSQNNAWEFVVQPTTLVSSQAVASPDALPNPWIAKLELTQ